MLVVRTLSIVLVPALALGAGVALAQSPPPDPVKELAARIGEAKVALDTLWVIVAACLVFFMNLGFACVESGFCRAKNTVTIMAKNFIVFAVASVAFLLLGLFAQDHFSPNTTGNGLLFGGGARLLLTQAIGVVAVGAFVVVASIVGWAVLRAAMGIRVSADEERAGLDVGEHGIAAYPEFHTLGFAGAAAAAAAAPMPARMTAPAAEAGR